MTTDDATIGRNLRRIREAAGVTQAELAAAMTAADVPGIYPQTIVKIEKGSRVLRYAEAVVAADVLGVTADAFAEQLDAAVLDLLHHRNAVARAETDVESARAELAHREAVLARARVDAQAALARGGFGSVDTRLAQLVDELQAGADDADEDGGGSHHMVKEARRGIDQEA